MSGLRRSRSEERIEFVRTHFTELYKWKPVVGLRRTNSSPDLANRYKPRYYGTAHRTHDAWDEYWWERRFYGGERFWPHYNFPYKRYWHDKSRTSSLAHYPSLSWTSRFSQYDKLDPVSWRRYRAPYYPFQRWGPYLDSRFEIRMSVFDRRLRKLYASENFHVKAYQPRIWHPNPSCWPYSYHFSR